MPANQEMLFDKILELALKDKLILWAGAGLSMEAGYPTGGELAKRLLEKLSEEEQKIVPGDLVKVSDYFVNRTRDGRDELISILKEIFKIEPKKSESHEIIKKLAFFKTIITTNYDELFEEYIPEIQVIKTTKDLSRSNSNSRKLIKIHGDLKSTKRLVLTQADYAQLYERDNRDPFWNKIRVELTEKGVLFIGYGFNDQNVEGLLHYLAKKLKKHNHPKYLVAPNLSMDQQVRLKSLGIHYFNKTGNDFFQQLYQGVWKTKGHKYFGLPEVSTDSISHSLKSEGLSINVLPNAEGGRIIQFNPEPGKVWDLSFSTKDEKAEKRIAEWLKGLGSDDLIIPKELVSEANLKFGDFVVGDKYSIPAFHFQRVGHVENDVRIVFEKPGVELFLTKVRSHQYNDHGFKIVAENDFGTFEIIIPEIQNDGYFLNGHFTPKEPCNSVSEVLNWFEAVYALGTGVPFKIYSSKLPKGIRRSDGPALQKLDVLGRNKLVFQVLRMIEEKFSLRFSGLREKDIFNDSTLKKLQDFLELFRTNRLTKNIEQGIPIKKISNNPEVDIAPLVEEAKEEGYFCLFLDVPSFSFLGQDIPVGKQQIMVENPYLDHSENEPGVLLLKSKNNVCLEFFEHFGLVTFKENMIEKSATKE